MFKLYRGLDGDPARGDAGGQISRTTALEFQEFYRVFQDLWPFPGFPGSVQSLYTVDPLYSCWSWQTDDKKLSDERKKEWVNKVSK